MAEADKKPTPIAEIVTGVIIVIILMVFALPRYMSWGEKNVVGDRASELLYDLMKAKNRAMSTGHQVWVVFKGNNGYTIFVDSNSNGQEDSGEVMLTATLPSGIQFGTNIDPPIGNVWGTGNAIKGVDLDDGGTKLYFDSKGRAQPGGAVYFINEVDVGVTNEFMRAVKILGATGEILMVKPAPGETPPWQ